VRMSRKLNAFLIGMLALVWTALSDECKLVSIKHDIAAIMQHKAVATQQEPRHAEL